ncbi:hypothetical protein [Bradyrhizobium sp. NBAIM01]|uniref:hypothetical protein n=1 Tax=Bradyrhizobium sp. NBAIM01 TaxID=2793818 RepID=UPI001CD503F4|nr:hypothetical protein [Bradyrhizobium sp. NBAIM01]MCA1515646.1 hypothetical protein [Bradyrhizobium sp. NBAIM01]
MLFRPSIKTKFRTAAFGAGLATLAAVATFPAAAQQVNLISSNPTDCSTIENIGKRAFCESVKHTEEMNTKIQVEAALKKCLVQIADFKKTQPAEFARLGTITRENACEVAANPLDSAAMMKFGSALNSGANNFARLPDVTRRAVAAPATMAWEAATIRKSSYRHVTSQSNMACRGPPITANC